MGTWALEWRLGTQTLKALYLAHHKKSVQSADIRSQTLILFCGFFSDFIYSEVNSCLFTDF